MRADYSMVKVSRKDILKRACPTCLARAGAPCTKRGVVQKVLHRERYEKARRGARRRS